MRAETYTINMINFLFLWCSAFTALSLTVATTTTLPLPPAPPAVMINNNLVNNVVDPATVRKVHLIFSNHYDAGFADYASNILNRYVLGGPGTLGPPHLRNKTVHFDSFLLSSAQTSNDLKQKNTSIGAPRLRYMTQAYIASYFADCTENYPKVPLGNALKCPNKTELKTFAVAVENGDIYWHAYPHNAEAELMDASFFSWGLSFSKNLTASFFAKNVSYVPSTVLSQRDVPVSFFSQIINMFYNFFLSCLTLISFLLSLRCFFFT